MTDSFVGTLLVASTLVEEPIFSQAVCLIVHQDEDNVIGVMLNRPMQPLAPNSLEMLGNSKSGNRLPESEKVLAGATNQIGAVHFGGPNSGPVVAVHGSSQHGEAEMGSGIYVAAQKQHVEAIVRERSSPYRLIIGHVGWDHATLDEQLSAGMWHVIPASEAVLNHDDNEMWARLIRRATASSVASWIGATDTPSACTLN